jgi:hypothetical protein
MLPWDGKEVGILPGGAVELGGRLFDTALPVLAGEHTRRNRRQVAKGCKRVMEYMNAV